MEKHRKQSGAARRDDEHTTGSQIPIERNRSTAQSHDLPYMDTTPLTGRQKRVYTNLNILASDVGSRFEVSHTMVSVSRSTHREGFAD